MRWTILVPGLALFAAMALPGCATETEGLPPESDTGFAKASAQGELASAAVETELQTWIEEWIQVDGDDANLYTGEDPADGTASYDLPAGGSDYIDWEDLAADLGKHRYLDVPADLRKDASAFPRSNSCVGPAMVLNKMDLTYVGAANNNDYAYFLVQRSGNTGDAAYYWVITRETPTLEAGAGACKASEELLTFDLRGPDASAGIAGDVLLVGHFHSGGPQLRVFEAVADMDGVLAEDAMNYWNTAMWSERTEGFSVAVNTTPTTAGSWGDFGVKASDGVDLGERIVAEAAVDLSIILGDDVCGDSLFGTVLTRSSASGEMSPDLKDLAGPISMDMETVRGHASLEPTCDGTLLYDAGVEGDYAVTCDWLFNDGSTLEDSCSGEIALEAGAWSAEVTLTHAATGCDTVVSAAEVELGEVLSVEASADATCQLSFDYGAVLSGDSGSTSLSWAFYDSSGQVGSSSAASGTFAVAAADSYRAEVSALDVRDGLYCAASAEAEVDLFDALGVDAVLTGSCEESFDYEASVSGGSGNASVAWAFSEGSSSTSPSGSVAVGDQPTGGADYSGVVSVTDLRPDGLECSAEGSDAARVYSPIEVGIAADASALTCPAIDGGGGSDAVTWNAAISGGTGAFGYDWSYDACDGYPSCTVDPLDEDLCFEADLALTVVDSGECEDATSETEHFSKLTTVTITAP